MRCLKKTFSYFTFAIFILFLSLTVSCVSRPSSTEDNEVNYPSELYIPQSFEWQKVVDGISIYNFENKTMTVLYHAVKIELASPNLELVCFPNESTLEKEKINFKNNNDTNLLKINQPFIFKSISTEEFANKNNCAVAMNSSPFNGKTSSPFSAIFSKKRQIIGIHFLDGIEFSAPNEKYSALGFVKSTDENDGTIYNAKIIDTQTDSSVKGFDFVLGGFFTVLSSGVKSNFKATSFDSRSGAGVSYDGKTLYLLVVEGENKSTSKGLSFQQCADIFIAMGCSDAIEFDGGSSSDLCINGKSVLTYKQKTVQASSFGFRHKVK
ncbi:MAG: phosphodiester glycosidase family protein [Treponema sp.]